ncbi:MAG: hypothetical protein IJC54_01465, partial [Clostridia bacterium]|nr:hypothetical protein [Clostridia bacterium]
MDNQFIVTYSALSVYARALPSPISFLKYKRAPAFFPWADRDSPIRKGRRKPRQPFFVYAFFSLRYPGANSTSASPETA